MLQCKLLSSVQGEDPPERFIGLIRLLVVLRLIVQRLILLHLSDCAAFVAVSGPMAIAAADVAVALKELAR